MPHFSDMEMAVMTRGFTTMKEAIAADAPENKQFLAKVNEVLTILSNASKRSNSEGKGDSGPLGGSSSANVTEKTKNLFEMFHLRR